MASVLGWVACLIIGLIALAALASVVLGKAFDRMAAEEVLTISAFRERREHEKSQLIVSAMRRDREAAFAAHTGSPLGEVPLVPKEGA